jgi:hypothetical protein
MMKKTDEAHSRRQHPRAFLAIDLLNDDATSAQRSRNEVGKLSPFALKL